MANMCFSILRKKNRCRILCNGFLSPVFMRVFNELMAEEEGFEPPRGVTRLSVFKTDPFSRTWVFLRTTNDNLPYLFYNVNMDIEWTGLSIFGQPQCRLIRLNNLTIAHIWTKYLWNHDTAVFLLVIFQNSSDRAAYRKARTV